MLRIAAAGLLMTLVSVQTTAAAQATAAAQGVPGGSGVYGPAVPSFEEFLAGIRDEALARGIQVGTLDAALAHLVPQPIILQRDRTQAESTLSLEAYLKQRLAPATVRTGRQMLAQNGPLLRRVFETYGVPPHVIVATWGIESNFGRFSGVRPVIPALATLAYDPRRSGFFREELFNALTILDRGHIALDRLKGSWAGAMGQPQFMPSSYLRFAVDFDGDGRPDIWTSRADVFASIANYLKGHGWVEGERWGRRAQIARAAATRIAAHAPRRSGGCRAMHDLYGPLPLARWQELGVRLPGGGALPSSDMAASVLMTGGSAFLVYQNYEALLAYNCAHPYALGLGLLSDQIASASPRT